MHASPPGEVIGAVAPGPGDGSVSRRIARSFRDAFTGPVVHRDLGLAPVPRLTDEGITARTTDRALHTPGQAAAQAVPTCSRSRSAT